MTIYDHVIELNNSSLPEPTFARFKLLLLLSELVQSVQCILRKNEIATNGTNRWICKPITTFRFKFSHSDLTIGMIFS